MQAKSEHSADSIALKAPFNRRFWGMQSIKVENHLKNLASFIKAKTKFIPRHAELKLGKIQGCRALI